MYTVDKTTNSSLVTYRISNQWRVELSVQQTPHMLSIDLTSVKGTTLDKI